MRTDDNTQALQTSFLTEAEDFTTSTDPTGGVKVAHDPENEVTALASADTNRAATSALRGHPVKRAVGVAPVDERPHEQQDGDASPTDGKDVAPPASVVPVASAENGGDGHPATGEVEEQVYYLDQGAGAAEEDLAAIRRKLGIAPEVRVEAGRLNLSAGDVASLRAGGVVRVHAPLDAVTWSPLALGREDRVAPALIDQRAGARDRSAPECERLFASRTPFSQQQRRWHTHPRALCRFLSRPNGG
ncbi:MAG TPA: hypothetical protein VF636_04095 [Sphingomonas sp.]|jgi:hypothetical protein